LAGRSDENKTAKFRFAENRRGTNTTLHHIALNVALEDFESEKMRLEGLGLKVNATVHEWLHVRSLYFPDPEGNLLEFVCYDASVG
jgi:catechol 2,3-dioxygenase-like lactoylglutathione lyase family enzyme